MISNIITDLRQKAAAYPSEGFIDKIDTIETEYHYMSNFMLGGGTDPHRTELYDELKARLRHIAYDIEVRSTLMESPYIKIWEKQLLTRDTSAETLQGSLIDDTDQKTHFEALYFAFIAILTSYHWSKQQRQEWTVFLASRQVNPLDQCTLVSALTLSAIEHFDKHKAHCLAEVYADSNTPIVKQRAFIGCLLALGRISDDEHKELRRPILDTLMGTTRDSDEQAEILELYMQMMTCANALNDSKVISDKLMPNIMRNQPFNNDNFDPETENISIEAMEKSMDKIVNMQKNGSDIFFAGFSQMKRFPFFQKYINWFIPFTKEHPDLPDTARRSANMKFVERISTHGPFCESDKYSFVIAIASTMEKMPENVKQMIENGEMGPLGMHDKDEDMQKPSLLRLQYMQDLFRFYSLCPLAQNMYNPFKELNKCHIGIATTTHISDKEKRSLCLYLLKKDGEMQIRNTVARLLNRFNERDSYDRNYCHAELKLLTKDYPVAIALYNKCMEAKNSDTSCMRGLAKAYYQNAEYDKAAFYYDALHTMFPNRMSYQLNYCMAMTMDGKAQEVLSQMFRLDYENPEDINVTNMLTWTLLHAGKAEQALNAAKRMIQQEKNKEKKNKNLSVGLNIAYAHFANNLIKEGIEVLKGYNIDNTEAFANMVSESMNEDKELLTKYNIGEAEIAIIADNILKNIK